MEFFNIDKEIDDQYSIDSSEYTSNILVNNNEIENETFCSLLAIFKVLIPVWKMGKNPVIVLDDILFIKPESNSRNIKRTQNYVMIIFCLLNEGDDVLKPDYQFSLCLYIDKENYEVLANVGKLFSLQLANLKEILVA